MFCQIFSYIKLGNKDHLNVHNNMLQVKNHIWIFINALIENPSFDSQTKENMTLQAKSFGSRCALSEKFINLVSSDIIFLVHSPPDTHFPFF